MVGHIVDINISTRLAAVHIEVDTFTILKIDEDWLPRIMDKVEGDLDSTGTLPLKNLTQNYRFKALIVETRCHRARAIELINSKPHSISNCLAGKENS